MADGSAFVSWAIPWTENWMAAIGRACWQGSVALFLAWALCRAFPRLPASFQCWLWRLAYLKLFVALLWATPVNLPILPPTPALPAPNVSAAWPGTEAAFKPEGVSPASGSVSSANGLFLLPVALVLLWLCGMLWRGWQIGREARYARSLRRQGRGTENAGLIAKAEQLCGSLGLRRCPRLLHGCASSPLVIGIQNPAILVPEALWNDCTPTQQRLILAHELAHVRRRDLLWAWLPLAARCVFWFLPSVWLAEREWQQSQEMACDEQALRLTQASRAEYGNILLKVTLTPRSELPSGLVAAQVAASYVTVQRRLLAMKQTKTMSRRALILTGTLIALAGVAGIIPWRAAAQEAPRQTGGFRENSPGDTYVIPKQLIVELSLTPVQIKQAEGIHEASARQVRHLLTSDQLKKLAELNGGRDIRMERLNLTEAQQKRLKALKEQAHQQIEALNADTTLTNEEKNARRKAIAEAADAQMKQIYTPEQMQTLAEMSQEKQADANSLGLSEAQQAQMDAMKKSMAERFAAIKGDDSASVEERDARIRALKMETDTQLQQILTPEQHKRMAEQEQQAREQDQQQRAIKEGGPYGLASLERLGLTPTQRNRIQAIYKDMEKQMERLLTPAQKQRLQKMRSTPDGPQKR